MTQGTSSGDGMVNPFWTFSLGVYRRAGVPERLLKLQDVLAADVNLVLFAAFMAAHRRDTVADSDVASWDEAVRAWREEVVLPLRAVRRSLKTGPETIALERRTVVREKVASTELLAEQLEQWELWSRFAAAGGDLEPQLDRRQRIAGAILAVLRLGNPDAQGDGAVSEAVDYVAAAVADSLGPA